MGETGILRGDGFLTAPALGHCPPALITAGPDTYKLKTIPVSMAPQISQSSRFASLKLAYSACPYCLINHRKASAPVTSWSLGPLTGPGVCLSGPITVMFPFLLES